MFVNKGALLIRMALHASGVSSSSESSLFQLKAAMSVMAICAAHRAFKNLVMEWFRKLGLRFAVAT
jgi:hypothetical protein